MLTASQRACPIPPPAARKSVFPSRNPPPTCCSQRVTTTTCPKNASLSSLQNAVEPTDSLTRRRTLLCTIGHRADCNLHTTGHHRRERRTRNVCNCSDRELMIAGALWNGLRREAPVIGGHQPKCGASEKRFGRGGGIRTYNSEASTQLNQGLTRPKTGAEKVRTPFYRLG